MTVSQPAFNASNSIIVRLNIDNKIGMLASVTQTISEMHGVVGAIDLVQPEAGVLVRDISIFTHDPDHSDQIVTAIRNLPGVEFINFSDRTFWSIWVEKSVSETVFPSKPVMTFPWPILREWLEFVWISTKILKMHTN
jgi:hypothetical protein